MTKAHILQEIKRATEANGGITLGLRKFENETGITEWDWKKFWPRWNDAVLEAGFITNKLTIAYSEAELLGMYAKLARELGRLPAHSDIIFKARNDSGFPTEKTFRRFGGKSALIKSLAEFCKDLSEYESVVALCKDHVPSNRDNVEEVVGQAEEMGFVYLVKSGRFYKIGKTNSAGRREYELSIQLPEKAKTIHVIRTDDPSGIEAYWHNRFTEKRKNGEWFELSAVDIAIFKRRKFM